MQLGHRYYDPGTGKFINRDPIGYEGGANLYAFCGGNPVNESDPDGFGPEDGKPGSNPLESAEMQEAEEWAARYKEEYDEREREKNAENAQHSGWAGYYRLINELRAARAQAEANAATELAQMEERTSGAHFLSRHGAQTTLAEQEVRAMTGRTPDGVSGTQLIHLDFCQTRLNCNLYNEQKHYLDKLRLIMVELSSIWEKPLVRDIKK